MSAFPRWGGNFISHVVVMQESHRVGAVAPHTNYHTGSHAGLQQPGSGSLVTIKLTFALELACSDSTFPLTRPQLGIAQRYGRQDTTGLLSMSLGGSCAKIRRRELWQASGGGDRMAGCEGQLWDWQEKGEGGVEFTESSGIEEQRECVRRRWLWPPR